MYKKFLIPVALDGQRDFAHQFRVAEALSGEGSKYTILHVIEQIPSHIEALIPETVRAAARNEAKMELKEASEKLEGASSVLLSGHAGRSIVDYATKHSMDCIIVASHVPVVSDVLLGSTASWIVRHAKCAVHVIR